MWGRVQLQPKALVRLNTMIPLDILRPAFVDALNRLQSGWTARGDVLVGPGDAYVAFTEQHSVGSVSHVDVRFVLDASRPDESLWDCVSGFGNTPEDRAWSAAHVWGQTTAGACLELKYSRRGEFADHYDGRESGSFTGWHAIAGAIIGFGDGDSAATLQRWWMENPFLPALARWLDDSVGPHGLHGIKLLFGGADVAEVRLDGQRHDVASEELAKLSWPRLEPTGFVRSYVIAVHRVT
jgi:Family of unknown function (DUF6348)